MWISMRWLLLITVTFVLALCLHLFGNQPAIDTAAAPPSLVPAKLGGKPVYVLYLTRSGDKVLVRCYPGQTPTLTVGAMGGQPGVKQGTLVCQ